MSVLGTGVAAGVAQTVHNAQQVARQRDRTRNEADVDAHRMRELIETHLRALEEGDESETPSQLHIDGQLPEHQSPEQQARQSKRDDKESLDVVDTEDARQGDASHTAADSLEPLYRHLDIQA